MSAPIEDLGSPSSYLVLGAGVPVFSSDGERLGDVEHVLADAESDIFDGLILDRSRLPGGHRFVDSEQVEKIYERGVLLSVDAAAAQGLPEPAENPAMLETGPEDTAPDDVADKLHRAWLFLTGRG